MARTPKSTPRSSAKRVAPTITYKSAEFVSDDTDEYSASSSEDSSPSPKRKKTNSKSDGPSEDSNPPPKRKKTNSEHDRSSNSSLISSSPPPRSQKTKQSTVNDSDDDPSETFLRQKNRRSGVVAPSEDEPHLTGPLTASELAALQAAIASYKSEYDLDDKGFAECVWAKHGKKNKGFWDHFVEALPGRTRVTTYRRLKNMCPLYPPQDWTPEDDDELRSLFVTMGPKWVEIGHEMERNGEEVRDRWRNHLEIAELVHKKNLGKWTKEEDGVLIGEVRKGLVEQGKIAEDSETDPREFPLVEAGVQLLALSEKLGTRDRAQISLHWELLRRRWRKNQRNGLKEEITTSDEEEDADPSSVPGTVREKRVGSAIPGEPRKKRKRSPEAKPDGEESMAKRKAKSRQSAPVAQKHQKSDTPKKPRITRERNLNFTDSEDSDDSDGESPVKATRPANYKLVVRPAGSIQLVDEAELETSTTSIKEVKQREPVKEKKHEEVVTIETVQHNVVEEFEDLSIMPIDAMEGVEVEEPSSPQKNKHKDEKAERKKEKKKEKERAKKQEDDEKEKKDRNAQQEPEKHTENNYDAALMSAAVTSILEATLPAPSDKDKKKSEKRERKEREKSAVAVASEPKVLDADALLEKEKRRQEKKERKKERKRERRKEKKEKKKQKQMELVETGAANPSTVAADSVGGNDLASPHVSEKSKKKEKKEKQQREKVDAVEDPMDVDSVEPAESRKPKKVEERSTAEDDMDLDEPHRPDQSTKLHEQDPAKQQAEATAAQITISTPTVQPLSKKAQKKLEVAARKASKAVSEAALSQTVIVPQSEFDEAPSDPVPPPTPVPKTAPATPAPKPTLTPKVKSAPVTPVPKPMDTPVAKIAPVTPRTTSIRSDISTRLANDPFQHPKDIDWNDLVRTKYPMVAVDSLPKPESIQASYIQAASEDFKVWEWGWLVRDLKNYTSATGAEGIDWKRLEKAQGVWGVPAHKVWKKCKKMLSRELGLGKKVKKMGAIECCELLEKAIVEEASKVRAD
ncbi:hypothetical protein BJ508DRAFT_412805 [Ascobolus immersus RN42]|uniref:Uncharacterized protein n=1 Tax=Ascobolus immersus RN42 TaxID=1160509 RepID=A0A3N4IJS6_ASCIM|nr:hypothetical protein BJ508DRAFT_412805 [Ascobolus immersus RN42]